MSAEVASLPAKATPILPDWYPAWTKELAELYFSGTINTFVLYGNVHDLVRCKSGDSTTFINLSDFLATQVFGAWDVTLSYDLGRGLRPIAGDDAKRLQGNGVDHRNVVAACVRHV